eukprot:CAMPEP_0206459486 /NCGR_PEP_ID=MMETSP0324_2-20121206/24200_1 /ASSEMBLY_ACC=CAM_ASM_000836 /TAXON_ID=2866 /ORGANISM="Crypthecodinium cohnii, Strain Seligo" /LENGTH=574 /DNA_ID=CAMNT_0053931037 /DNA_START=87 /DNA_END=1811 /DNA_ORIENTATION=-
MGRLPKLLRYFQLSHNATQADLRQAYLNRAKKCHPDISQTAAAHAEFSELQRRFEEAKELMANPVLISGEPEAHPMYKSQMHWERVCRQREGHTAAAATAVPCHGLPASKVYAMTAAAALCAAVALSTPEHHKRGRSPANTQSQSDALTSSSPEAKVTNKVWPPLESGPWSVAAARVERSKATWAPSKNHKYLDSGSFYSNRARGHLRTGIGQRARLGEKQGAQVKGCGYAEEFEPVERDGVEMLPVHLAAEEGKVWWLEKCGASESCRPTLQQPDSVQDTPLHHAMRVNQQSTAFALLRLGSDIEAKNAEGLTPIEVANQSGHKALAKKLQDALDEASRLVGNPSDAEARTTLNKYAAFQAVQTHPDGLGVQVEPPEEVTFVGIQEQEVLRRAVNMSAGYKITPRLPIPRSLMDSGDSSERLVNIVRGSIQDSEFMLEETDLTSGDPLPAEVPDAAMKNCGLLFFEAPGAVSPDASGNWFAVRRFDEEGAKEPQYWRLDPVRGPFLLTVAEFQELVKRYKSWALIRGPEHLRQERTEKLNKAREEAYALIGKRDSSKVAGPTPPPPPASPASA